MGKLDEYFGKAKGMAEEKLQSVTQDTRAGREIKQGIAELQALPEFAGSILYTMELETMINDLKSLLLFIGDKRLDDESVVLEIRKVMGKVQPSAAPAAEATAPQTADAAPATEAASPEDDLAPFILTEDQAIEKAKVISYSACMRALAAMSASAGQA